MATIHERIKERRIALNLTLAQVADRLGIQEATMQRYESGAIKNLKHETVVKLADILYCHPAYLMGWLDTPNGTPVGVEPEPFDEGIELYKRLDVVDKAEIRGTIKQMLKSSKYKKGGSISDDIVRNLKEKAATHTIPK